MPNLNAAALDRARREAYIDGTPDLALGPYGRTCAGIPAVGYASNSRKPVVIDPTDPTEGNVDRLVSRSQGYLSPPSPPSGKDPNVTNRPPTRICSTCSHELHRDNRTDQCRECKLIDRNRTIERGRQLALGEPDPAA